MSIIFDCSFHWFISKKYAMMARIFSVSPPVDRSNTFPLIQYRKNIQLFKLAISYYLYI